MKKQTPLFRVLFILTLVNLIHFSAKGQYCVATHSIACSASSNLNNFSISGTSLSNLGTGCTAVTAQAYTIYAPAANTTATLLFGQSYTFNATTTGSLSISMWIDYDHSNTFDASEWTQLTSSSTTGVQTSVSVTIPLTSVAGPTGLRIRTRAVGSPNLAPDACLTFGSGETEDYTVTLDPGIPCSGAPIAGTTTSNDTTVCPSAPFNLSLAGSTIASGLTYQWESSLNNTTWTAITGATFIGYQATQTVNTYYRCIVTCSGQSATSTPLLVTTNTFINCYCTSSTTSATGSDIGNITFATLNNGVAGTATNNPSSTNLYTDFTALPATAITQGAAYPIAITQINSAGFSINFATVHIDFNQDGIFDPVTETTAIGASNSTTGGNIINGNVLVPFTALPGQTRMRIVLRAGGSATQSPCGTYPTGETEDYLVSVLAGSVCSSPPTAGAASSSLAAICGGGTVTISLTGNSIGAGQTYQWQSSPNNSTWSNIATTTTFFNTTITANIFYRCIVTCNGLSDTSTVAGVNLNPATLCYCVTGLGGGSCGVNLITTVEISGTTLNSVSADTCTFTPGNTLTVYPPIGSTTASLIQGVPYNLNVTLSSASIVSVWIDFNQDGTYSVSEWTQIALTSTAGTPNTIQITVPFSSGLGQTGMRIRSRGVGNTNGAPDACTNFGSGETEDYIITLVANVACSGAPTAGTTSASINPVCPNVSFSLSLTGSTLASGLSYQWQSSVNNTTWTNITGANGFSYTTAQTADAYYRCIVSCSAASDTSTSLLVTTNSFFGCYCNSNATDPSDSDIGNVSIGSLNNGNANPAVNNPLSNSTYTSYTSVAAPVLLQGLSYPIAVTQINLASFLACNLKVYIDYNRDGIYNQATEEVLTGQTNAAVGGNVIVGNVTVPLTASIGLTGMRVVLVEGTFTTVTPCGTYFNGETEDYIVDLQAPQACTTPPAAGTAVASIATACANIPFDLNLTGSANASGLSYQWQESANNINWTNISGATSILFNTSLTASTYYRCVVTCSSVSSNSTPVLVTLNSFFNCYCNSGSTSTALADIGNVTFGLLNNGVATPSLQNPTAVNSYTDFTNLPPFSYIQSLSYPISLTQITQTTFTASSGAIFIDYDHDGNFDPTTEEVLTGNTNAATFTISGNITIPLTALTGLTRMRVVLTQGTTPASPCGTYTFGETEDYLISILAPNSCSLPFIAGFAKSNTNLVCASDNFTLSIDSLPPDTGFSFQWQRSLDSINWTAINGATIQVYIGTQSFDTWYRCNVSCNGGAIVNSTTVKILNKAVTLCNYCNATLGGNCSTNYFIDSLAIGSTTLNNAATGCAANAGFAYSKYPISGNTTASLARGNYYDLYVKTIGSCNISVWLDYDQSGTFDANEWIQVSQATDSAIATSVPLVIPPIGLSKLGTTGLRIRSRKAGNLNLGSDGCSPYGSGETEDYYVTLVDAISTGKELTFDKNVKIYPNPSTGLVGIEYKSEDAKSLQINIMSAGGRLIFAESNVNFKGVYRQNLDLSSFPKGIYFIQFISDKQVINKKIVLN